MSASADLAYIASAAKADAPPAIEMAGVNKWFGALWCAAHRVRANPP
jgi:hypothetical protein